MIAELELDEEAAAELELAQAPPIRRETPAFASALQKEAELQRRLSGSRRR